MAALHSMLSIAGLLLLLLSSAVQSVTFTFTNNCGYTVWPGLLSNAGVPQLETTGFSLSSGESQTVNTSPTWSGRFWGRTLCSTDPTSGKFTCATGECGSGDIQCSGSGAIPPATLAEFTLSGSGGMDYYDVSLVDGYNLPMLVVPQGGSGDRCSATGCLVDLNSLCPSDLKVFITSNTDNNSNGGGESVACKSACEAFGSPQYCCSGAYGNPNTCHPSAYSQFFKNACPRAYSYAYDDATSTFTCAGANYVITFCPNTANEKAAEGNSQAPELPLINTTTVNLSGYQTNNTSLALPRVPLSLFSLLLFLSLSSLVLFQLF